MKNGPVIKIGPGEEFPSNTPKQYLQGWVEFYKLKFTVTSEVLIPRPETELLVDEVLQFILRPSEASGEVQHSGSSPFQSNKNITILDIGTGSGNIAISIAKNLTKAKIFATDVSDAALDVARENARKHRVENRIFFINSDLLSKITFDVRPLQDCIIVSNLPYIPSARIPYLDPSVKDFEPRIALDGGPDGFELYRKLFQQISEKFLPSSLGVNVTHTGGVVGRHIGSFLKLITCEIDYTQGEIAAFEAQKYFPDAKIEVKTDLSKKQRILVIQT